MENAHAHFTYLLKYNWNKNRILFNAHNKALATVAATVAATYHLDQLFLFLVFFI